MAVRDGGGRAAGHHGGAVFGAGSPVGERVVTPGGTSPSRIFDRAKELWEKKGRSSRACGKAGRKVFWGFRLSADPRSA